MIEQTIYFMLTLFIPIRMTYFSVRHRDQQSQKLWAVYWAFYFGFKSLQCCCWLLQYKVFDFVFILLGLWLYNDSYKGGLFLADFITHKVQKIPALANVINTISEKAKFLNLFESSPVFRSAAHPKTQ